MYNHFLTIVETTKLFIIFRRELWNINDLDAYFGNTQNRYLFQQKVVNYGIIGIKICQWISQRVDILGKNTTNLHKLKQIYWVDLIVLMQKWDMNYV